MRLAFRTPIALSTNTVGTISTRTASFWPGALPTSARRKELEALLADYGKRKINLQETHHATFSLLVNFVQRDCCKNMSDGMSSP